jgi:hypothetical protein
MRSVACQEGRREEIRKGRGRDGENHRISVLNFPGKFVRHMNLMVGGYYKYAIKFNTNLSINL